MFENNYQIHLYVNVHNKLILLKKYTDSIKGKFLCIAFKEPRIQELKLGHPSNLLFLILYFVIINGGE